MYIYTYIYIYSVFPIYGNRFLAKHPKGAQ